MFQAMLCDDNEIILEGLSRQIDWEGLGICLSGTAADGQDAWNQMKDNPPDILITDIRMPYIDGLELSRLAKDLNPNIVLLIISAYDDFEYARTAIRCGVREYILKPLNRFEVAACLERLLDMKAETMRTEDGEKEEAAEDGGSIGKEIQYIEHNFYRSISLEEVSQAVHMNTAYFSTLFKKQTGKKYIDYVTDLRMEKARKLILNTDLKIGAIAEMVGYGSTKHFTRIYKEKFGTTPNADR